LKSQRIIRLKIGRSKWWNFLNKCGNYDALHFALFVLLLLLFDNIFHTLWIMVHRFLSQSQICLPVVTS
jgi:hypothetical protein